MFTTAMSLFLAGTLVATFAPTFGVLLIARVVQAAGTAMVLPLLMTTTLALVPLRSRGTVMGLVGVVISAAPALGPTISGFILEPWAWTYLFDLGHAGRHVRPDLRRAVDRSRGAGGRHRDGAAAADDDHPGPGAAAQPRHGDGPGGGGDLGGPGPRADDLRLHPRTLVLALPVRDDAAD